MCEQTEQAIWQSKEPCVLGIDEAGRGPVLGPMVYAAAVCPKSYLPNLRALGVNDSKQLKEEKRDLLRTKVESAPFLKYFERVLTAEYLSHSMLQTQKYNLNRISHDAALDLVQTALDDGIAVNEVYVDTVGNPEQYANKFRNRFPFLEKVVVAKKADSTYRIVGAASIVAKTTRDRLVKEWHFPEVARTANLHADNANMSVQFVGPTGSGYPSDPITKAWMDNNYDKVFGFPNFVRFSWGTSKTILAKNAVLVEWECDEEEEETNGTKNKRRKGVKTKDIKSFFSVKPKSSTSTNSSKKRKLCAAGPMPELLQSMALRRTSTLL